MLQTHALSIWSYVTNSIKYKHHQLHQADPTIAHHLWQIFWQLLPCNGCKYWQEAHCANTMGPTYLSELCWPTSSEAGRRHLRSATSHSLIQTNDCWQNNIFLRWSIYMEQFSSVSERRNAYLERLLYTFYLPHSAWSTLEILLKW